MRNVTTGFPDPSQPDDQNAHSSDQSPFRAPRGGEGRWDNSEQRPKRQRELGRQDAAPSPEVVALWNKPPEPPVPRGNYYAVITRVYDGKSDNNKEYCALVFRITHGAYADRCFHYYLWMTDNAIPHTRACIAKFGIYYIQEFYRAKLTGRPCMIFIDAKNEGGSETDIKRFDPLPLPPTSAKGGESCGAD